MGRLWRVALLVSALVSVDADAQVIEFESGGLKYQALTKDGLTIMIAPLSTQVRDYTVVQVAIQNGGTTPYTIRPEDFLYRPEGGIEEPALPARTVVYSLIDRASKGDVIKLITAYESSIYGNSRYKATNGFEYRRQSALAEFTSTKVRAAAAASAIALVQTKIAPGQSTDGAIFYTLAGKPLHGALRVRVGNSFFEFPVISSNQAP